MWQVTSHDNNFVSLEAGLMSALALAACIVCLPPLFVHLKAGNLAATVLVLGVATVNFQNFVNPLIWPTNAIDQWWDGEGLCDIESKIYIGFGMAIVGATTSIFRQLAIILDTDRAVAVPYVLQRRWRLIFEVFFCIVTPIYSMLIHYIIQSERYWIVGITGCTPSFDRSWLTYVLIFIWPIIICIIGTWYCSLAVFRLVKYRRQMPSILAFQSSMTRSCFTRLFILACGLLMAYFPLAIYTFVKNLGYPLHRYTWRNVHRPHWSQLIYKVPSNGSVGSFDRWIQIGTGYALFFFFGLGHEAVAMYKTWITKTRSVRIFHCWTSVSDGTRTASIGRCPLIRRYQQDGDRGTVPVSID